MIKLNYYTYYYAYVVCLTSYAIHCSTESVGWQGSISLTGLYMRIAINCVVDVIPQCT